MRRNVLNATSGCVCAYMHLCARYDALLRDGKNPRAYARMPVADSRFPPRRREGCLALQGMTCPTIRAPAVRTHARFITSSYNAPCGDEREREAGW